MLRQAILGDATKDIFCIQKDKKINHVNPSKSEEKYNSYNKSGK